MSTPFLLPQPVAGTATGWQVVDFLDATYTSGPATGGAALLTCPQLDPGVLWELTHMVCENSSTAVTRLRLYLDAPSPGNLRDGSDSGNFDVADWPQGLHVPQGRSLIAQWTGADDGSVGTLTIQGRILRQG